MNVKEDTTFSSIEPESDSVTDNLADDVDDEEEEVGREMCGFDNNDDDEDDE